MSVSAAGTSWHSGDGLDSSQKRLPRPDKISTAAYFTYKSTRMFERLSEGGRASVQASNSAPIVDRKDVQERHSRVSVFPFPRGTERNTVWPADQSITTYEPITDAVQGDVISSSATAAMGSVESGLSTTAVDIAEGLGNTTFHTVGDGDFAAWDTDSSGSDAIATKGTYGSNRSGLSATLSVGDFSTQVPSAHLNSELPTQFTLATDGMTEDVASTHSRYTVSSFAQHECGNGSCRIGFVCQKNSSGSFCFSKCESKPNYCLNNGICSVNSVGLPMCWCPSTASWWFRGERCEVSESTMKLSLIAGGCILFTLTTLIAVVLCMSRIVVRQNKKVRRGHRVDFGRRRIRSLNSCVVKNDMAFVGSCDLLTPIPPTFDAATPDDSDDEVGTLKNISNVQYRKTGVIAKVGEARTKFTSRRNTEIESVDETVLVTSFRSVCSRERTQIANFPTSSQRPFPASCRRPKSEIPISYRTTAML